MKWVLLGIIAAWVFVPLFMGLMYCLTFLLNYSPRLFGAVLLTGFGASLGFIFSRTGEF